MTACTWRRSASRPPTTAPGDPGSTDTNCYSPCDHKHPVQTAAVTPITDAGGYYTSTNVEGALQEAGASIAASGAPATADYLVGTAQAGLSAEIVVGTTPGGELGGTWASPTVDATHSGSAHTDYTPRRADHAGRHHVRDGTGPARLGRAPTGRCSPSTRRA